MFKGLELTSGHSAVVVDLLPYDGSLQRCILDLENSSPKLVCSSIVWAGVVNDRAIIQNFLYKEVRNHLYQASKDGKVTIPGLGDVPLQVGSVTRPTFSEDDFKLTRPEPDHSLPLRQAVYDEWGDNVEFKAAFRALLASHNVKFNPTEKVAKTKRPLDEQQVDSVDSRAVALPGLQVTRDALANEGELVQVLGTEPFWEMWIVKGKMYLHALSDGVVSDEHAICGTGSGEYLVVDEGLRASPESSINRRHRLCPRAHPLCAQHTAHVNRNCWGGSSVYNFDIRSDSDKAAFSVDGGLAGKFPASPRTYHEFLSFLEKNGEVDISIPNHTMTREKSGDAWNYKINPDSPCVYRVTQKFGGKGGRATKPRHDTVGALLDANTVKESKNVDSFIKFTHANIWASMHYAHGCDSCNHVFGHSLHWQCILMRWRPASLPSPARYNTKERSLKPTLVWFWLCQPIRLTKGTVVQVV